MSEDTILKASEAFTTEHDGVERHVRKGETFRVGHPLVEGREELFEPFEIDNEYEEPEEPSKHAKKAS